MDREETKRIIRIIKGSFPNFKPTTDEVKDLIETWEFFFKDYTYQQVSIALKTFILGETKGFPPTAGQIVACMNKPKELMQINENEAWELVSKASANSLYNSEEEFNKLPDEVKRVVGCPARLKEMACLNSDEFYTVERSHFLRQFRAETERQKEIIKLPSEIKELIGTTINKLEDNNDTKG